MKKCFRIIAAFCFLCVFCAFTWPPEKYEMPRTVLDAATVEESLSGLEVSFGSIANTGLILIGIVISVSLIASIFRRLFLGQIERFNPPRQRRYSSESTGEIRERNLSGAFHRRSDDHKVKGEDRL